MLEYGMPPTFGASSLGERFFAYLVDKPIRETQFFPLMKPKEVSKKSKEKKTAVAVINSRVKMENWQRQNTVAHLAAELGVREGRELLKFESVSTKDNQKIPLNIQHAILIKDAENSKDLLELFKNAKARNLSVYTFTREMLETTNNTKVKEATAEKNLEDIEFLGVMVFGESSVVDEVTGSFTLST